MALNKINTALKLYDLNKCLGFGSKYVYAGGFLGLPRGCGCGGGLQVQVRVCSASGALHRVGTGESWGRLTRQHYTWFTRGNTVR